MTIVIILIVFSFIAIIAIQLGKVRDLAAKIKGEEESELERNTNAGKWLVGFMVVFLVACFYSAYYYKNYMLGYGPWEASSVHGKEVDGLFQMTLWFTGIVFVLTHIVLFWYGYKYRIQKDKKAVFFAHDTKLELIWTAIPAVVMAFLVVNGLIVWNNAMADANTNEAIEIEATGYQFAWEIRYPGADGKIGDKDFRLIDLATNALGIDFTDRASMDDYILSTSESIKIPVDTTVRVRITSKDVLHNFYLPHFRVKMDAVPGMPTYFAFKPTKTTQQMRQELKAYPEWNTPYDPADPEGPKRWEKFDYEVACAELCGRSHFSMKRIIEVVSKDEYETWVKTLPSFYSTNIRGTEQDPNKDKLLLDFEKDERKKELSDKLNPLWSKMNPLLIKAAASAAVPAGGEAPKPSFTEEDKLLRLKHVFFETGSANLNPISYNELDHISGLLKKYPYIKLAVGGHTDSIGDASANKVLSAQRAAAVKTRLVSQGVEAGRLSSVGYGSTQPIETNENEPGRKKNRRTELKVVL
jgi:cytochrome c oxidase subunit II